MSRATGQEADVFAIAGSLCILDALGHIGASERVLPPVTIARQAARRFALLDELDYDPGTRDKRAQDGLTWVDVHTLKERLGIAAGHRSPFWDDLELLRCTGYLQLRWELPALPANQQGRAVSLSVVRVREALLSHPSLRHNGSILDVAQRSALQIGTKTKTLSGRLQELTCRSEGISLLVSPTRPGLQLVRAAGRPHERP